MGGCRTDWFIISIVFHTYNSSMLAVDNRRKKEDYRLYIMNKVDEDCCNVINYIDNIDKVKVRGNR